MDNFQGNLLLLQLVAMILVGLDYFPNIRRWIYKRLRSCVEVSAKASSSYASRNKAALIRVLNKGGVFFFGSLFVFLSTLTICEYSIFVDELLITLFKVSFCASIASVIWIFVLIARCYALFFGVMCRVFFAIAGILFACHKVKTLSVIGFFIHAATIAVQYVSVVANG